ncbi:MAG: phospholipid carrier-dependent glycosyltransferase [Chloroflexi bacterium]|nr:phospholipid carrier-dependent glycosyltransferase [Chloroflexota bacterium]
MAGRIRVALRPPLSLLLLIAFALRLIHLSFQPLWWDEGWTFYFATQPLSQLIQRTAADIHPPLYYVLLKMWFALVGIGPWQARFFSVLAGMLTLPILYVIARQLLSRAVALTALVVIVAAPFDIYYSQEVRMYALLALFSLAATYALLRLMQDTREKVWWVAYVLCAAAALYTEYYAALVIAAHVVAVGLSRGRRNAPRTRLIRPTLLAWAATAFLYLPWVIYAAPKLGTYVAGKVGIESYAPLSPQTFLAQHAIAWSIGHPPATYLWLNWLALIPLLLALIGVLGLFSNTGQEEKARHRFLLLYLFVPLALGYLINLRLPFHPVGFERLLLPVAPAFWLLIAAGLVTLQRRSSDALAWGGAALLAVTTVLALNVFYTAPRYPNDDYRPIMARLQALGRSDDVLLAIHPWQEGYVRAYLPTRHPELFAVPARKWARDTAQRTRDLDALRSTHGRIWFPAFQTLGRILENEVAGDLNQQAFPIDDAWYGNTRLYFFAGGDRPAAEPVHENFADQIELTGLGRSTGPVSSAYGIIKLNLRWKVIAPPKDEVRIVLRLADTTGRTWANRDSEPLNGTRPFADSRPGTIIADAHGLLVPAGTPPGDYRLTLGLYRRADGRWLERRDSEGRSQGVNLFLGNVRVVAPDRAPPPNALPIEERQSVDLDEGIRFLGYTVQDGPYQPGEPFSLMLFWQARESVSKALRVFVQVIDDQGKIWGARDVPPVEGAFPTNKWSAGTLVRDPHPLILDPATPDGTYRLIAGLYDPATGRRLRRAGGRGGGKDYLELQNIVVKGRPHQFSAPANLGEPRNDRFDDWASLVGYVHSWEAQTDCALLPGGTYTMTLTWKARGHTATAYKSFVHLEDREGRIWGQSDQIPGPGAFPTTGWLAGEYLRDRHTLQVRPDTPPGTYQLTAGLYEAAEGRRATVRDNSGRALADHLILQQVTVCEAGGKGP